MQSEQDWLDRDDMASERYQYFNRPEPRENMSDIYEINDPYLGPNTKVREVKIGMVRNAAEENKKVVLAYLQPFPHTRIDDAKPLQGWYQSKFNESKQSRPRPCFTEAILTEPFGGWCQVGCSFSLPKGELVSTSTGGRPIESFEVGDTVYGRSWEGVVETKVIGTSHHYKDEGIILITLSDGRQLKMTGDHPVYSIDRMTWVRAEDLRLGEELEDESVYCLSNGNQQQEILSRLLVTEEPATKSPYAALSRLWRSSTTQRAGSLQRLCTEDSVGEWKTNEREISTFQRRSQVSRDQSENVRLGLCSQGGYGEKSQRSKVSGMEGGTSGEGEIGNNRLQAVEAARVHRQEGTYFPHEVRMGRAGSQAPRSEGLRLGLRAYFNISSRRISVPTRLQAQQFRHVYRGKRLFGRCWSRENTSSQGDGLQSVDIRSQDLVPSRNPYIVRVERISGRIEVFDIETVTGNFYQRGILVHNCYINNGMRGYRGTGLITVPMNYGDQIAKQLRSMRRAAAGYFSSFTDPFLSLESYYHNTQRAAEEFVKVGLPIFFLSRLAYPEWAIDLLTKNPHSYAQKSINTSDPTDWRHLSPGAIPLMDHMREITELKRRGIYVSIQVNPIVPGVTSNEQILKLFKMLKEAGADHVIVKFVEAAYSWAPAVVEKMKKVFGKERGEAFEALFTQNIGAERTVDETYRLRAHKLYSSTARRLGLTYATCYEYEYERDEQGKILSKVGKSIGRKFATSSQCHGHTVPVYARLSAEEPFLPLEECPPSGCLYCAEENTEDPGKPRCGDELAGASQALRFADLKIPIGQGKPRFELPLIG